MLSRLVAEQENDTVISHTKIGHSKIIPWVLV